MDDFACGGRTLPWKKGNFYLPIEKVLCKCKLNDAIIQQQLKKGLVGKVSATPNGKHVHYIPHHSVIRREVEIAKLGILYGCSARKGNTTSH